MTNREFYLKCRKAEFPVFKRVLQALPEAKLTYRPHERCSTAQQIVTTMEGELKSCVDAATNHRAEFYASPAASHGEAIALFEQRSNELVDRVSQMSDSDWEHNVQLFYKGTKVMEQPLSEFLWMIHFDAIHHRGQLTSYLRPMGGKVPAIYGPSADERPA